MDKSEQMLRLLKKYHWGRARAVPLNTLAKELATSTRKVRKIKNYLVIEEGQPIGSTADGYFYAESREELSHFVAEYMARSRASYRMIKAYQDMLKPKGQLMLDL